MYALMWVLTGLTIGGLAYMISLAVRKKWRMFWYAMMATLCIGVPAGYLWIAFLQAMQGWADIGNALD